MHLGNECQPPMVEMDNEATVNEVKGEWGESHKEGPVLEGSLLAFELEEEEHEERGDHDGGVLNDETELDDVQPVVPIHPGTDGSPCKDAGGSHGECEDGSVDERGGKQGTPDQRNREAPKSVTLLKSVQLER